MTAQEDRSVEDIQEWLVSQLSNLLVLEPDDIDVREPLDTYGLASREAVMLSGDLEEWLGQRLSPTLVYEYPTIEALARCLASGLEAGDRETAPKVVVRPTVADGELEPVAIVGIGCRFPGADSPEAFWRLLLEGVDAVSEVPPDRWKSDLFFDPNPGVPGKTCTRWGGFLKHVDQFDAQFFGIAPREAVRMDPQQRLLLEVTWEAMEDAGYDPQGLAGSRTGVFIGISNNDYSHLQYSDLESIEAYTGTGNAYSIAANRLSYFLDLRGPSCAVDTACSSSLVSTHLACCSLHRGESDLALSGGVNLILSPELHITFSQTRLMSPTGRCRTFDAAADGYVRGEGCGVVVLKRLADALADGDRVLAVIRGSAVNHDGRSNGITAPNGLSQQAVIREALDDAGIAPDDLGYVETHGTGTKLGDPIEVESLGAVLEGRALDRPCLMGSVKTNIGHLEAAAGVAGLIKTALLLRHGEIPPHLHLTEINPYIPIEELPLEVATSRREWSAGDGTRYAGVSSFGFGGANAHVVLSDAQAHVPSRNEIERPWHALSLSARDGDGLRALAGRYEAYLAEETEAELADICHTANTGRSRFPDRLVVKAQTAEQMRERLSAFAAGREMVGLQRGRVPGGGRPKVAFLFTGQGAQYLDMGRQLYETQPTFRAALDQCAEILRAYLERPLLSVIFSQPEAENLLDETTYTQPALFAIEYALGQLWRAWGITPDYVLGHSVGEYVAACEASILTLKDGLELIATRGRLMGALPQEGAMAVVFAGRERVLEGLTGYEKAVNLAATNGPSSTVISGEQQALKTVLTRLENLGVGTHSLTVSHAFHSPLMEPILGEFEALARELAYDKPRIPFVSNLTGRLLEAGEVPDAGYWRRHIRQEVKFQAGMEALNQEGVEVFVELGPHPHLLSMGRRCLPEHQGLWLPSLRRGQQDWSVILDSLGALHVRGLEVDWSGFDSDYERRRLSLPTYPFQRKRYWFEPTTYEQPSYRSWSVKAPLHPLLGERVRSPLIQDNVFESHLSPQTLPLLDDHRVYDTPLLPATAYLEMALAAAQEVYGPGFFVLEQVAFLKALAMPAGKDQTVQVTLTPAMEEHTAVRIFSLTQEDRWQLHATGRLRLDPADEQELATARFSRQEIQSRCSQAVDVDAYYRKLAERGLDYGPGFRGIAELWRRDGEALSRVRLPGVVASKHSYHLHPTLLDAGFQTLAATLSDEELEAADGLYLPTGLEAFRLYGPSDGQGWSHVVLRSEESTGEGLLVGDLRLFDSAGRAIAEVDGLQLRRVGRETILGVSQHSWEDWLYEVVWRPEEIAEAPSADSEVRGPWIVLMDQGHVGTALSEKLEARGEGCVLAQADEGFGRGDDGVWAVNPSRRGDFEQLLRETLDPRGAPRGVVHLWNLDVDSDEEPEQMLGTGSLLHLTQALVSIGWSAPPRLWVVTRGSQPVDDGEVPLSVFQASAWGLSHVIALEHPEFRAVCVDLDPSNEALEGLLAELEANGDEDRVAFREGVRYVARLVRGQGEAGAFDGSTPLYDHQPVQLTITERGTLDNLALSPIARRWPGPGEIEIQVHATGLNFRDVLNALDLYPGEPGPLGGECAGTVVAVGDGVTALESGDEVVAIAPGSFASLATTYADLAVKKPSRFSWEEAATIPIAFLTAYYTLHHLAGMSAGERVLIHSASGGVGQAAVQLAQRANAEIFATAGSPEKRAFLRSLGIRHVMDSRSLDFADQILQITGDEGVDIVLNGLPGDYVTKGLSILRECGRFLELGKMDIWSQSQVAELKPRISYHAVALDDLSRDDPELVQSLLRQLMGLFEAGELNPLPLETYPLEDVDDAFRYMAQAKHVGKIVISQQPKPMMTKDPADPIRGGATYLITGGLGALGQLVARWLVDRGARYIVLIGRSEPSEAASVTVRDLEAAGARVTVVQADVSQRAQVGSLLARLRDDGSYPPLRGVVHAAGVLDDGVLLQQDWERFERVMAPKVEGAWNLHILTQDLDLDFFICFSSVASLLGSPGQGNYAAANAFMDALAHHRQACGMAALTVNWGPWAESGMAVHSDAIHRLRRTRGGLGVIPPDQGLQALGYLLEGRMAQMAVVPVDWSIFVEDVAAGGVPPLLSDLLHRASKHAQRPSGQALELLDRLEKGAPSKRQEIMVDYLRGKVIRILGLEPSYPLDTRRPLNEMGFDSLMAVELKSVLNNAVGRNLPATLAFEYPTIDALAQHLTDDVLGLETRPKPTVQETVTEEQLPLDSVLDELEQLSEDEAETLLLEKLAGLEEK